MSSFSIGSVIFVGYTYLLESLQQDLLKYPWDYFAGCDGVVEVETLLPCWYSWSYQNKEKKKHALSPVVSSKSCHTEWQTELDNVGWIATSLNMSQPMLPMKCCHGVTVSTSQRKRVWTQLFTFAKCKRCRADGTVLFFSLTWTLPRSSLDPVKPTGQFSKHVLSASRRGHPSQRYGGFNTHNSYTHAATLTQTLTKYLYLMTWFPGDSEINVLHGSSIS